MSDRLLDDKLIEEIEELDAKISYLVNNNFCLTDSDFYPPSDDRVLETNILDIDGGDNFADYCESFFEMLDQEEYFEK